MKTSSIHPPKPRRRCEPSKRDQQIYLDYQTTGRTQTQLAADRGLTQCRISQIVQRVERWLAGKGVSSSKLHVSSSTDGTATSFPGSCLGTHSPEAPASSDPTCNVELETCNAAHADLDRALLRRYMSFACREAIRQFQSDRVTVTTKKGSRGDRAIDETTKRREPPPVQCLNILIRACALLERLQRVQSPKSDQSQKKPATTSDLGPATLDSSPAVSPNDPYSIDASSEEMRRLKVENWLASERGKRKPRRPDGNIDFDCVDAAELVSAVLAEPHDGRALEIIAADIGKRLVDKAGAVIPVCQNPETETESNTETDEPRDLAPPPSPTRPLTRSSASDLALPASDDTLSYGERMRRELRARVNSICARSGPPPQRPAPQAVAIKLDLPKVISPPKVPPELQTLYDKVVHLQRMRAKRLPCSVHFTPEEESQLWRLPSIYLEDA